MIRVLILGRAQDVWEEAATARTLCNFDEIIAVGSTGCDYPGELQHWCSFHINLFQAWIDKRSSNGHPKAQQYWSAAYKGMSRRSKMMGQLAQQGVQVGLVDCKGGSSGYVAVQVALGPLKADKVVLAGVPMTREGGRYNQEGDWKEAIRYRGEWRDNAETLKKKVRSMSGWTQELLGAPDKEWLENVEESL